MWIGGYSTFASFVTGKTAKKQAPGELGSPGVGNAVGDAVGGAVGGAVGDAVGDAVGGGVSVPEHVQT